MAAGSSEGLGPRDSVPPVEPLSAADLPSRTGPSVVLLGHTRDVREVRFSPDGATLYSVSDDGTVRSWDVAAGVELAQVEIAGYGLVMKPDGSELLVRPRSGPVSAVAAGSLESRATPLRNVGPGDYSPDGSLLAYGSGPIVRLWDFGRDSVVTEWGWRLLGYVTSVAWNPEGTLVAAGYMDRTIRVWQPGRAEALITLEGHAGGVVSLAWSADGRTLVLGAADSTARIWDVASWTERAILEGHGNGSVQVAVSPDGRHVATGSYDQTVRLWDIETGAEITGLRGHEGYVQHVAFGPDGRLLASSGRDGKIVLWDVEAALRNPMPIGPPEPSEPSLSYPVGSRSDCRARPGEGATILGQVVDSLTGGPVGMALMHEHYSCRVYTEEDGRFSLSAVPPRHELPVGVSKSGYASKQLLIDLDPGDTALVTFRIARLRPCDPLDHPELPRVETEGDLVILRLPAAMRAALDRFVPGFRPANLDEIAPWIRSGYVLTCYQTPSVVIGDLNGDGEGDLVAIGFVGRKGHSFVLLSDPDDEYQYIPRDFAWPLGPTGGLDTYVQRVEPGERLTSPMEEQALVLLNHGFSETYEEKGGGIFYVVDGELRQYVTGD